MQKQSVDNLESEIISFFLVEELEKRLENRWEIEGCDQCNATGAQTQINNAN